MCTGIWLIGAEAKPEKDELIVNDYDLEECESVKKTVFDFSIHRKKEY